MKKGQYVKGTTPTLVGPRIRYGYYDPNRPEFIATRNGRRWAIIKAHNIRRAKGGNCREKLSALAAFDRAHKRFETYGQGTWHPNPFANSHQFAHLRRLVQRTYEMLKNLKRYLPKHFYVATKQQLTEIWDTLYQEQSRTIAGWDVRIEGIALMIIATADAQYHTIWARPR